MFQNKHVEPQLRHTVRTDEDAYGRTGDLVSGRAYERAGGQVEKKKDKRHFIGQRHHYLKNTNTQSNILVRVLHVSS